MQGLRIVVLLGLLCLSNAGSVPSLKEANFDEQVFDSGKNAFVKFFAPWCNFLDLTCPCKLRFATS